MLSLIARRTTRNHRPYPNRILHRTIFSEFLSAARQILRGDDHVNPKKKLERRYLYTALLACTLQEARKQAGPTVDPEEVLKQTFEDLEKKDFDATTNVDLRFQLQQLLNPQIQRIFQTIYEVDQAIGIPASENGDVVNARNREICREVLLEELGETQEQLNTTTSSEDDEHKFFATKISALEMLLQFNGWSSSLQSKPEESNFQSGLDPFGMGPIQSTTKLELARQHQTLNLCRSALIRRKLGFSVLCLRSSIAGRGLFIDGTAMAGSLVALQPGDIWPKEHLLTTAPDVMEHFAGDDDDCHISLRFDDYVVDSRTAPVTVLAQEGSLHPFGLAHMANHTGGGGTLPNVQSTMFDYTAKIFPDTKLTSYIPNSYARTPTWQSRFFDREETIMHGLGLVTRRDVSNEELTYDYRLQSETPPAWYSIVKYEDGLENDQVVFFRDDWR